MHQTSDIKIERFLSFLTLAINKCLRFHSLMQADLMSVQDLQSGQGVDHTEFVIWLVGGWVVKQVQMLQVLQLSQTSYQLLQVSQLVVVQDQCLYMFQLLEYFIYRLQLIFLSEDMLQSEIMLQALKGLKTVLIHPQDLQIGKINKVNQLSNLPLTQMHLSGVLSLFDILNRDDIPRIALYFVALRHMLGHQGLEGLIHAFCFFQQFYICCTIIIEACRQLHLDLQSFWACRPRKVSLNQLVQLFTIMNSRHPTSPHHAQSTLKITQKGKYKIRSISLPNSKQVPIHNEHQKLAVREPVYQENFVPEFWGCLVSDHFKKMQRKTLMRVKRSKTQQKMQASRAGNQGREREGSTMLLKSYLRRKTKKEVDEQSQKYQKIMNEKNTKKMVGTAITEGSEYMPQTLQKYIDTETRQNRLRKSHEIDQKIHHLNELIKWRGKVIQKIQNELHNIKLSASNPL